MSTVYLIRVNAGVLPEVVFLMEGKSKKDIASDLTTRAAALGIGLEILVLREIADTPDAFQKAQAEIAKQAFPCGTCTACCTAGRKIQQSRHEPELHRLLVITDGYSVALWGDAIFGGLLERMMEMDEVSHLAPDLVAMMNADQNLSDYLEDVGYSTPGKGLLDPRLFRCVHLDTSNGCLVYDQRPWACRGFTCVAALLGGDRLFQEEQSAAFVRLGII